MDPRAFVEALVTFAVTPVVSIVMSLAVIGGILLLVKKFNRG